MKETVAPLVAASAPLNATGGPDRATTHWNTLNGAIAAFLCELTRHGTPSALSAHARTQ
jgi:hypothetical protein